MPFSSLPSPLQARILNYACQDDGTTGLSLSSTSRSVRSLSASHRYQSIRIVGWKELLAFEERFASLPKEQQGIVNLYVELPSVFEAAYPDDAMWERQSDEPDDESYAFSDDSDDSTDESDTEVEETSSDVEDPPQESAYLMAKTHSPDLQSTLTGVESDQRPSFQAEGHLYTTMRRLLDTCSHTLEVFTLHWKPRAGSQCGAAFILPDSLPKLKSLAVWQEGVELYDPKYNSWESWVAQELENRVIALPSLERLETNVPVVGNWPQYLPLGGTRLKYATAPCASVKRLHDIGARRIRIFCSCPRCYSIEWPVGRNSFRANDIYFKQNWEDQVVHHSTHIDFVSEEPEPSVSEDSEDSPPTPEPVKAKVKPVEPEILTLSEFELLAKEIMIEVFRKMDMERGEDMPSTEVQHQEEELVWAEPAPESREVDGVEAPPVAVLVFAWLEDGGVTGYLDAVLLADEKGCIRLDDHAERLSSRGLQKGEKLEMYNILQKAWFPVTEAHVLGPFHSKGVVLLRCEGVKEMSNFDAFLALARL